MKGTVGKFEIAMRMNFDDLNASDAHDGDVLLLNQQEKSEKEKRTMSTFDEDEFEGSQ